MFGGKVASAEAGAIWHEGTGCRPLHARLAAPLSGCVMSVTALTLKAFLARCVRADSGPSCGPHWRHGVGTVCRFSQYEQGGPWQKRDSALLRGLSSHSGVDPQRLFQGLVNAYLLTHTLDFCSFYVFNDFCWICWGHGLAMARPWPQQIQTNHKKMGENCKKTK